jgi:hypothetical protein
MWIAEARFMVADHAENAQRNRNELNETTVNKQDGNVRHGKKNQQLRKCSLRR